VVSEFSDGEIRDPARHEVKTPPPDDAAKEPDVVEKERAERRDSAILDDGPIDKPEEGDIKEGEFLPCPNCGKTAIRTKDTSNQYHCRACSHNFTSDAVDESVEPEEPEVEEDNETDYTKCVNNAIIRLTERHPDWEAQEISAVADAACSYLKEMDSKEMEDGVKLEKCVLKVKKQLKKEHPDWNEDKIKSSAFAICNASQKGD